MDFVNLKYKPKKTDLICEFYIEPNKISLLNAADKIASESSVGTWTEVTTMKKRIEKLKAVVFSADRKTREVKIAYPLELFEKGNMPQILSSIAGNIFGMKDIKNLRLQDIHFPKKLIRSFKGPKFGISGIRKILKVPKRPLVGTIIKPKLGLNEKEHAKVAYEAWSGGLDIVKDDENLSSMRFNSFKKRVAETLKLKWKAEKETGEKKIYMPNVTSETKEMIKRAKFVKKLGGEYIMADIITLGWGALQSLRDAELGLVIHAHRAGHAILTRNPRHGISMLIVAKIARLIGVDQMHIGTAVGKMEGSKEQVKDIGEEIESRLVHKKGKEHILEQRWYNLKPVFAVCSGGIHPGMIPREMKLLGNNIIMQFGGGCHGHPDGTRAGARAIRQAVDASLRKIPLKEYARTHSELKRALQKWEY